MVSALYLDGWTVERFEQAQGRMTVWASYGADPPACPHCGVLGRLYRHGTQEVPYADAPLFGLPTTIRASVRRYRCREPECGRTSFQALPDMEPGRQMTRRCIDFIERQTGHRTWADTAEQVGIDEKTVREVTAAQIVGVNSRFRPYAPRTLGIDELKLDGSLRVMLVDIDRRQLIDILEQFNRSSIVHWLSHLPDRDRIRLVAMDMSDTFHGAVRAALPEVPIVADKFHVVRASSGALNSIRLAKGRAASTKAGRRAAFRGRHMLAKRPHNLTAAQAFKLDGALLNDPDLKAAYDAKEAFYRIWDAGTRAEAEAAMEAWLAAIPTQHAEAFKQARRALEEWREEVLTFWGDQARITNAYTESVNGMTKIANRAGRGYRFEVIRARMLLDLRSVNPDEMVECDGCGVGFAAGMLVGQERYTGGRGRLRRPLLLCPNCVGKARSGTLKVKGHSTLQSG